MPAQKIIAIKITVYKPKKAHATNITIYPRVFDASGQGINFLIYF